MGLLPPENSTNVRPASPLDPWPAPARSRCGPAVALLLWAGFVTAAALQGVFEKLEPEAYGALVAFVALFAAWAARVDAEIRHQVAALPRSTAWAFAFDALVVVPLATSRAPGSWCGAPAAIALLVALPLAIALHAAGLREPRVRTAPGGSPGGKRAAT